MFHTLIWTVSFVLYENEFLKYCKLNFDSIIITEIIIIVGIVISIISEVENENCFLEINA